MGATEAAVVDWDSISACGWGRIAGDFVFPPSGPDHGMAVQNQDIWEEAAFFAALCTAAALLLIPRRRAFLLGAAIVLAILGLLSLGDLVNARDMTNSAIGVLFLVGNLIGSSGAIWTTVAALRRYTPHAGPPAESGCQKCGEQPVDTSNR